MDDDEFTSLDEAPDASESFVQRVLRQQRDRRKSGSQYQTKTESKPRARNQRRRKLRNAQNVRKIVGWFSKTDQTAKVDKSDDTLVQRQAKEALENRLEKVQQQIETLESIPFNLEDDKDQSVDSNASKTRLCESDLNPMYEILQEDPNHVVVDAFLKENRRQNRLESSAVRIQSQWKMFRNRRVYKRWKNRQFKNRNDLFVLWALSFKVRKLRNRSLLRSTLAAWHEEVKTQIKVFVVAQLYEKSTI